MSTEPDDTDNDDYLEDEPPPRERYGSMVAASILGIPSLILMILCIVAVTSDAPEEKGEMAVMLRPIGLGIAWITLVVCSIITAACAVWLVSSVRETRRARANR